MDEDELEQIAREMQNFVPRIWVAVAFVLAVLAFALIVSG